MWPNTCPWYKRSSVTIGLPSTQPTILDLHHCPAKHRKLNWSKNTVGWHILKSACNGSAGHHQSCIFHPAHYIKWCSRLQRRMRSITNQPARSPSGCDLEDSERTQVRQVLNLGVTNVPVLQSGSFQQLTAALCVRVRITEWRQRSVSVSASKSSTSREQYQGI